MKLSIYVLPSYPFHNTSSTFIFTLHERREGHTFTHQNGQKKLKLKGDIYTNCFLFCTYKYKLDSDNADRVCELCILTDDGLYFDVRVTNS